MYCCTPCCSSPSPSTAATVVSMIAGLSAAAAPWYNVAAYGAPAGVPPKAQAPYIAPAGGSLASTGPIAVIALLVVVAVVLIARMK